MKLALMMGPLMLLAFSCGREETAVIDHERPLRFETEETQNPQKPQKTQDVEKKDSDPTPAIKIVRPKKENPKDPIGLVDLKKSMKPTVVVRPPVVRPVVKNEPKKEPTETPTEVSIPDKKVVHQVIESCQQAREQGELKQKKILYYFPPTKECEWSKNGNWRKVDYRVSARKRQSKLLIIPQKAKLVCDIDFNFPTQEVRYDDELIFTLKNTNHQQELVLAMTQNYGQSHQYPTGLLKSHGVYLYDWQRIRGQYYNWRYAPPYCAGVEDGEFYRCELPPTQTRGQFRIDSPQETVLGMLAQLGIRLNSSDSNQSHLLLNLIVIGDNDSYDCQHSGIKATATIEYVEKDKGPSR